jgi:hypothetical protein
MSEHPRFVDLVQAVNDNLTAGDVRHGFGGAIALAYYVGVPRATRDLDVNICVPVDEAASVLRLLPPPVSWSANDVAECQRRGQVRLWVGRPRDGIPVDLFFPQHRFHEAVAQAVTRKPFLRGDYTLPVIAAAHLTVFKVLFDRPKDWVDIADMLKAGTVDVAEALYWVQELLGVGHPSFDRLAALVATHVAHRGAGAPDVQALPEIDWASLGGQA